MLFRRIAYCLTICAGLLCAADGPSDLESLTKQHQEASAKYNAAYTQYYQAREALSRQDDVAELSRRATETREVRERKLANSAKVVAAQKAYTDIYAALNQTLEAEVAADPEAVAVNKSMEQIDDQIDEIDSQQRLANFLLTDIQRRAARKPDMRQLAAGMDKHEVGVYELHRRDPKVAAAYRAYTEAQQLFVPRPELEKLRVAYEDACKASPVMAENTRKREAAKAAYEQALAAKVAANPQTSELKKKIEALDAKLKDLAEVKKGLTAKQTAIRQRVSANSAKVAEARKVYYAADTVYRQAMAEECPNETAAMNDIDRMVTEKMEEKVAADTVASSLKKEMEDWHRQTQNLAAQLEKLKAAKSPAKG